MKKTALYERLESAGGKFVEFGGFFMPVQFESGILSEHRAVRNGVGLFDVSHMGEFVLEGEDAVKDICNLFTNEFRKMPNFKVRYTLMCNEEGGVVDDLLVYKVGEKKFYLVVNASNIDKDREWIKAHIKYGSILTDISGDVSMIAVQGPLAESLTKEIFKELPKEFYTFGYGEFNGEKILVSRTGYTGEDGFEIYAENRTIGEIFDALRAFGDKYNLMLVGLGARDTLRLESAMPLYGHEMNEETLATEIGLDKYIKFEKDEFIGKEALEKKTPEYKRIGVKITDKGIARERCAVFLGDENIGYVTSGTMSPTLGYSIGMARVRRDAKTECGGISIDVRGRRLGAQETAMPFIKK